MAVVIFKINQALLKKIGKQTVDLPVFSLTFEFSLSWQNGRSFQQFTSFLGFM
jgi:hypothetical protein